jgi:hypothetical protein
MILHAGKIVTIIGFKRRLAVKRNRWSLINKYHQIDNIFDMYFFGRTRSNQVLHRVRHHFNEEETTDD